MGEERGAGNRMCIQQTVYTVLLSKQLGATQQMYTLYATYTTKMIVLKSDHMFTCSYAVFGDV